MAGDLVSPEARRGLLARLFGKSYGRTVKGTVHRSEQLNLSVPADRAEAARTAIEQWLVGHGVTTAVTVEEAGEGKSRIRAKLGDEDAAKLDFTSESVQSELQDVLLEALHS
jgi:predicted GNAT family acetyltransferase